MAELLRTRRQTRATILARLLATGGCFRQRLAAECRLTEASISRIVAELREEGVVEELRRPAPHPGGPTQLVALRQDLRVAGIEIAHGRLAVGLGRLAGAVDMAERLDLPAAPEAAGVQAVLERGLAALAGYCAMQRLAPRRIAVAIPGFRGLDGPPNPILPLDPAWLAARLRAAFPEVPVALANATTAHAALHLPGDAAAAGQSRQLFVYLGHGVGGAWAEPGVAAGPIRPVEIGHVVVDRAGPACRCGHRGCLEAIASTAAIARLCGRPESRLIAGFAEGAGIGRLTSAQQAALRQVLLQIGLVIGNALNLLPASLVALCGWPAALPETLRGAVAEGLDASLFGGSLAGGPGGSPVALRFLLPAFGAAPRAALALAAHSLVRDGALAPLPAAVTGLRAG
jgi:predicted NBD/HSP70 family sugar kinase